jgi:hypothetical protein
MSTEEPTVHWFVADACDLGFADASYHVLFAKTLADCFRTCPDSQTMVTKMLSEAHRVLVPGGCLVLLDKHSPQLHWNVRVPYPYELVPEGSSQRRWFCHELRTKLTEGAAGYHASASDLPLQLDDAFRSLVVRERPEEGAEIESPLRQPSVTSSPVSSASNPLLLRLRAGDRITEVNGVSDPRQMRQRLQRAASVTLDRPISAVGWRAQVTLRPLGRSVSKPTLRSSTSQMRHVERQRKARRMFPQKALPSDTAPLREEISRSLSDMTHLFE